MDDPYNPYYQGQPTNEYPEIPEENSWDFALGQRIQERMVSSYHQRAAQEYARHGTPVDPPQQYAGTPEPIQPSYQAHVRSPSLQPRDRHHNPLGPAPSRRRYCPDFARKILQRRRIFALRKERDTRERQQEAIEAPAEAEEAGDNEHGPASFEDDEEPNDEEPFAAEYPETVTAEQLRYSNKRLRAGNMSIFHRKEFAFVEVTMTAEEHFQVKGIKHVLPQTFTIPDKNGEYPSRKAIRITWKERDILNEYRVRMGLKPHVLRPGAQYAAARDYWRLHAPIQIEKKTIEWSSARGDVPAP